MKYNNTGIDGKISFFKIFLPATVLFALLLSPFRTFAWPTSGQWIPVYKTGNILQDPNSDTNGSRNVVSDATHAAAYMYNDGAYIFFRLRLDKGPAGQGGQGLLEPYGWGVELDTNQNPANYEWLIMVDGISQSETISLWQNTVQATLGDPSDKPEVLASSTPLSGNYVISTADSAFNGDQDYFLDWRFSYSVFKQATGLTDSSPLRLFFGSSSSANTLKEQGADLVGASDLIAGFSDYVLPVATTPTTGIVRFASDLAGNGDVTETIAGNTAYIRVDDGDQNFDATTKQTITITITTAQGDREAITLTETGINTGIFTGSIATASALPTIGNGSLQVMPGETVTVTYNDAIDASRNTNQQRTDTLLISPPVIAIAKTVDLASVVSGATITYTITITNSGNGDGWISTIQDILPNGFTYIPGTTTGLTTADPSINSQNVVWNGNWIISKKVGAANGSVTLAFKAKAGGEGGTRSNSAVVSGPNISPVSTGSTAPVTLASPLIVLTKQVSPGSKPGTVLTYSVYYHNLGGATANSLNITDSIPYGTTYVPGSLRTGAANSTFATAAAKTDAADADAAEISGANVLFKINAVAADDGVADSGPDEGIIYFQVTIN